MYLLGICSRHHNIITITHYNFFLLHTIATQINASNIPLESSTPKKIIEEILKTQSTGRRVFFVDLGCTTKDVNSVRTLLDLAWMATRRNWYVVVSLSSGGGWMIQRESIVSADIFRSLTQMTSDYEILQSSNFTDEEAKVFIDKLKVDIRRLEKDIETANNPRILRIFAFTKTSMTLSTGIEKYDGCHTRYEQIMTELVRQLLLTMDKREFDRTLKDCLKWLEYARYNVPVDNSQKELYKSSYLHHENLTYCIEEKNRKQFTIKMYIPSMYAYLLYELKRMYWNKQSNVHNIPVVREYLFEEAFFQSEHLRTLPLSIKALNVNTSSPRTFTFSSLTPASAQQRSPITTNLEPGYLYHLRPGHLVIDSVCVASSTESEQYLLLLQVSLSSYLEHLSKAIAIRQSIHQPERMYVEEIEKQRASLASASALASASFSIAKYYQYLGGNVDDDKVIYVYVSPKETEAPNDITFSPELRDHGTRGSTGSPAYWYGFIDSSMKDTLKMIEDSLEY